ncbi:hypothetical protein DSO57_1028906 [Entomophthora muscae]|uniref:Uncharacterized protein n=1 Tax=Entomophthora muscae TaxID=34485 RepID=A0ACC2TZ90_9FUNG|nr:hypothetical protein DSO57_1028906 [Entomophthora muscae]
MEFVEVASKKIQADGHNVSIFPAGHANLHLGHVLFFNIEDTICERNPTTFSQVVSAANDVRIDNYFPLETQAQGQDLNPDPESLQAACPED